jgi:hypothetical protein
MMELIDQKRIHFVSASETRAANLYTKLYKSECKGKPLSNFWDVISYITHTRKDPRTYPTQKPIKLLQRILEISTNRGDWVLDPTAGSGTTGAAAKSLGRHFCLLDINPDGRDIFMARIKDVQDDNEEGGAAADAADAAAADADGGESWCCGDGNVEGTWRWCCCCGCYGCNRSFDENKDENDENEDEDQEKDNGEPKHKKQKVI